MGKKRNFSIVKSLFYFRVFLLHRKPHTFDHFSALLFSLIKSFKRGIFPYHREGRVFDKEQIPVKLLDSSPE